MVLANASSKLWLKNLTQIWIILPGFGTSLTAGLEPPLLGPLPTWRGVQQHWFQSHRRGQRPATPKWQRLVKQIASPLDEAHRCAPQKNKKKWNEGTPPEVGFAESGD